MRFIVCLFGVIACAMTAAAGAGFLLWPEVLPEIMKYPDLLTAMEQIGMGEFSTTSPTEISFANTGLIIIIAALYGFLGCVFVLFRCGKQAALLMGVTAAVAVMVNPLALTLCWFAIFVALCCAFIGPLPLNAPKEDEDEEEEEAPKPKAKAKPPMPVADEEEEMPRPKPKAKPKKSDDE